MKENSSEKLVMLARLDTNFGFNSMGEAIKLAAQLQNLGINAIAEVSPGAPLDGVGVFYLKVPADQLAGGQHLLQELLKKSDSSDEE